MREWLNDSDTDGDTDGDGDGDGDGDHHIARLVAEIKRK